MQSLWRDEDAARFDDDLGLRVYTSRLLGREPTLVLHGGGNTSVKLPVVNRFGESEDTLFVKGSGWDLATIEREGFTPVRLAAARRLARIEALSDADMVAELGIQITRAGAPAPSVETILHAVLPYRFVDHTHADAILAMTHTADGEQRVRKLFGNRVVIIPYVMPGFVLAQCVAREFSRQASGMTVGMVLLNHGLFTFGNTARESYERTIELVDGAERYLARNGAWAVTQPRDPVETEVDPAALAGLRSRLSKTAGAPLVVRTKSTAQTLSFARSDRAAAIIAEGPVTPDHSIRTRRLAMLGDDVDGYAAAYRSYFATNAARSGAPKSMLDPAPRVVVDPRFGVASVGRSVADAKIVEDIFENSIDVMLRAEALGGYRGLAAADVFDVEYWDLEQAKLKRGGRPPAFLGEVALVTGAASGIGKATVQSLLARGAAVVGLDRDPGVATLHERPDFLGVVVDVTDEAALAAAVARAVAAFGGIDMLVVNAGIFPASRSIRDLETDGWRQAMGVNVEANVALLRLAHPYLKLAPQGGRVVVIGSKNVPAPGPGAAAYSASKAALAQLARVAALEWGEDGIRVNTLHPNAVFDTGIWSDQVLAERASRYGLTIDEYKRNNVLRTEVTSRDVAELAAEMLGPLFARTTGAQLPVDGGNDRVI